MKRSKNQAVYRFLPEMWISERNDTSEVVTSKIKNWNYRKMEGIYDKFIDSEIKRQIRLFENRNGDISAFNLQENTPSFEIVETACIENTPDIMGEISPLVFYCGSCGTAFEKKSAGAVDKYTWRCPECKKNSVKQLQMIYTCECGYAQPIKIPNFFSRITVLHNQITSVSCKFVIKFRFCCCTCRNDFPDLGKIVFNNSSAVFAGNHCTLNDFMKIFPFCVRQTDARF